MRKYNCFSCNGFENDCPDRQVTKTETEICFYKRVASKDWAQYIKTKNPTPSEGNPITLGNMLIEYINDNHVKQ